MMPMKPVQCRIARTALEWSNADLAEAAKVGVNTVSRFEQGADVRVSSVHAMQTALEARGVVFIGEGEASLSGGVGVRLKE